MTDIVKTDNPFGNAVTAPNPSAMMAVETNRAAQEVQASVIVAKKFPRDEQASMEKILRACGRKSLAEAAVYEYSRGGTDITGPSIRLAEVIAQNWQNLQFGIRELSQANGESEVEAFCWDLETNVRETRVFKAAHIRYSKTKGNTTLTDPRDIYELVANVGARRLRACILAIIPGDVTEAALKACDATLAGTATPEQIKALVAAFEKDFGIEVSRIEAKVQHKIEALTATEVAKLRKTYAALKDGFATADEQFPSDRPTDPKQTAKKKEPEKAGKKEPEPPPSAPDPLSDDRIIELTNAMGALQAAGISPMVAVQEYNALNGKHVTIDAVNDAVLTNDDAIGIIAIAKKMTGDRQGGK